MNQKETASMQKGYAIKKLIATALKELLESLEYDEISIGAIMKQSGMNRRTFYNHFKGKDDLVAWIFETEVLMQHTSAPTLETWKLNTREGILAMYRNKTFYQKVFKDGDVSGHYGHELEFVTYAYRNSVEQYLELIHKTLPDDHIDFIARFYAAGYVDAVFFWVQNGMKESPEWLLNRVHDLSTEGIFRTLDKMFDS